MSEVLLRWAKVEDFPAIALLDRASWSDNRNSEFIPDGEHVWRVWIEHAYVCVAVANQKIIGVALSFPSTQANVHFLHKIFLAKEYRRQGVGEKLLARMCVKYDECGITAQLTTDTNNTAMQCLAETLDFSEKELVKGYYRNNEDRLVITRVTRKNK